MEELTLQMQQGVHLSTSLSTVMIPPTVNFNWISVTDWSYVLLVSQVQIQIQLNIFFKYVLTTLQMQFDLQ